MIDVIRVQLDEGAYAPTRAHDVDAGLDLYSTESKFIPAFTGKNFDIGVHVEIPKGYYGRLESKSGLNVKHGIFCPGGTIDSGYSGSITVRLYNATPNGYYIWKGDKICQLVIVPCELPKVEIVDQISSGDRGNNGFGSTGR